jgi:hypothetical protein
VANAVEIVSVGTDAGIGVFKPWVNGFAKQIILRGNP